MKNNLDYLLSPLVVRDQAQRIFLLCQAGQTHFSFHLDKLNSTVDLVLQVIRENYPDLNIPFHSRWGHFNVGKTDRLLGFNQALSKLDVLEQARAKLDLVIVSVLLDAGAGMAWRYFDEKTEMELSKSEGLAVASLRMFLAGAFSNSGQDFRVDARKLMSFSEADILSGFQVTEKNPLVGVTGRVALLNNLGKTLKAQTEFFKDSRPGNIIDYLIGRYGKQIEGPQILRAVLDSLGPIWPGRIALDGTNLGDVWYYKPLDKQESSNGLVAFHKLSQWLTYSLIEPIIEAGISVTGVEKLTGLAEYRNGGLIIDSGLVTVKNPEMLKQSHKPESEFIIEWRALTVHLLDLIGNEVQKRLGKSNQDFPLAKVLEGGTWWAGRKIAKNLRADGGPPVSIASDGTVF